MSMVDSKNIKKEKIRICFIGCGQFCNYFVPLFKAHPAVEFVGVCDKIPQRSAEYMEKYKVDKIFDSFEDVLASDEINCVAIFSQRNQHGWMSIEALKAGKNVYSAVPMATDIEEIKEIVRLVEETGLTYMMGETGVYRPASIFCREKYAKGEMGELVYAEAQYNHDMTKLYKTFQYSESYRWEQMAGLPPFYYPTHSTSMVLSAANTYAKKVAAFGYVDKRDPNIFGKGKNYWDNPFSNSSMLIELENGGIARISENRNIAWEHPETWITQFCGTKASYENSLNKHHLVEVQREGKKHLGCTYEDVSDLVEPIERTKHKDEPDFMQSFVEGKWSTGEAPIQKMGRLPKEFENEPTGHAGTHKFMVDDFCQAYMSGWLSPTNAWQAAKFNLPGLVAHESAMQGGIMMEVPDLGNPPEDMKVLAYDREKNVVEY